MVFDYLKAGEVSLSTLDLCGEFLSGSNGAVILESLRGKSFDEAEQVRAILRPEGDLRDRIELVVIKPKMQSQFSFGTPDESDQKFRFGTNDEVCKKCRITFSASPELAEKLERAKDLNFRGASEDLLLENILGKALDLYLEKHCPKNRLNRRQKRLAKREAARQQPAQSVTPAVKQAESARYIPIALRDEVLKRDNYECSFEHEGVRCVSGRALEIDHIQPFAKGGKTELPNLRVLCAVHNEYAAFRTYGFDFIAEKIAERRAAASG